MHPTEIMVASKDMPPRVEGFVSTFIKNQFRTTLPIITRKDANMNGKVAIITGSNTGIGLESSKQLLDLGLSRLIMAVRSTERGEIIASKLRLAHPTSIIDVWYLDMLSYQSVHNFVQRCDSELNQIDTVILNAGVSPYKFMKSESTGHEEGIQVNYLSTVLLTILLVPVLKTKSQKDSPGRITISTSILANLSKFPNRNKRPLLSSFDDTKVNPWDGNERYMVSKLLGQLFLVKLADYVNPDDVIINMVEPGFVKGTELLRNLPFVLNCFIALFKIVSARTVQKGAVTYTDAVVAKGKDSHGCLLVNCEVAP